MEDRITPAIYLEMSNQSPANAGPQRAAQLASLHGVEHVSWWENCLPNRDDLPRKLSEFVCLVLVEADLGFEKPAAPNDTTGILFHRTPRPGQGILSDKPTLGLELVLVSPTQPEDAQTFRDWADFIHIRDIAAANVPHFTMITPYENVSQESPRYMHLYELDTLDPEPAFKEMTPTTLRNKASYGAHRGRIWAGHPTLVIEYVNTFRRVGKLVADRVAATSECGSRADG